MDILKSLPTKDTDGYGDIIPFGDIVQLCKIYGQDNHDLVEANLKELERLGLLIIFYMDEYLIIGARLKN